MRPWTSKVTLIFIFVFALAGPLYADQLPDDLRALRDYVDAFDQYESERFKSSTQETRAAWQEMKAERSKQLRAAAEKEFEQIDSAIRAYEKLLDNSGSSADEPYAMFNLARAYFLKGQKERSAETDTGVSSFSKASELLGEMSKRHKSFEKHDLVHYLQALSLEAMGQSTEATQKWKALAGMMTPSIYVAHANIILADQEFNGNNPAEAVKFLARAAKYVPVGNDDSLEYERARIAYRTMWAAFKSANAVLAEKSALELLSNRVIAKRLSSAQKVVQDAVEILGDTLYMQNDFAEIKRVITNKNLVGFAGRIALKVTQLYSSNNRDIDAIRTGELALQNHPLNPQAPLLLDLVALGYERQGKQAQRITTLEKLALMLPKDSLWRKKNAADYESLLLLDQKSEGAARVVAAHYYDQGLGSGNRNDFDAAGSFYRLLLSEKPNGPESSSWRLKEGHCHYFTGAYDEADKVYLSIKSDHKVEPEDLEVAGYQLVMTRERRWRETFASVTSSGKSPQNDSEVIAATDALEKAIEDFANRFPDRTRTVDTLLVAASVNRDIQRFENASKFWQRTLISRPTPQQRGTAIRGLLYVALQANKFSEAIQLASQFLRLEDWRSLGTPLKNEVIGILAAASRDEGKRLNDSGKLHDAGTLLSSVAGQFPEIPDRERQMRDGAYMLAVAGDWNSVLSVTSAYLAEKQKTYADEMSYLLARSYENQMRFKDAAAQYLKTGRVFPKYKKALFCLSRAETLAAGDNDFQTAGEAALSQGGMEPDQQKKLTHLQRATDYFLQVERADLATRAANARVRASRSASDVLASRLIAAKARYQSGDEVKALDEMREIAAQADRSKVRLGEDYAVIAAETNFLIADDDRLQFEDYNLFDRGGDPISHINQKAKYFENLARNLDKVARLEVPEWSSQARYNLASAAEQFAQDVLTVKTKSDSKLGPKAQDKLNQTAQRLQRMAKRYFGENLLARNRNPALYRDNPWVKKSMFRLAAYQKLDEKPQFEEELQASLRLDIPQNWSL